MDKNLENSAKNTTEIKEDSVLNKNNMRNKKMRRWLGVNTSVSANGHPDDYSPIFYGDEHSGWNR